MAYTVRPSLFGMILNILIFREVLGTATTKFVRSICSKHPDLESSLMKSNLERSVIMCARVCGADGCHSILYNDVTTECRIYSTWLWQYGSEETNWRYYRNDIVVGSVCGTVPDPPANGFLISNNGTFYGDVATYGCNESYELDGGSSGTIQCLITGLWDTLPVCTETAYMIRIQGNNMYWHVGNDIEQYVTTLIQDDSDYMRFIFQPQTDLYFRIIVKATGRHLHENASRGYKLNTRYQPDDSYTRFFLELQTDNSYRIYMKTGDGYIGWDGNDNILKAQGNVDGPYNRFYLEHKGVVVTPF